MQFSRPEFRILTEFEKIFNRVEWNQKYFGKEIDIYLPDYKFGIEIDGYWHINKFLKDKEKNDFFKKKKIKILRIREPKLIRKVSKEDFFYNGKLIAIEDIKQTLKIIKRLRKISFSETKKINVYLKNKTFLNEKRYKFFCKNLPYPPYHLSLAKKKPAVAKTWDYERNKPLTPKMFLPKSNVKMWWICNKDEKEFPEVLELYKDCLYLKDKHPSYESSIDDRSKSKGCRLCSIIKARINQQKNSIKKKGSLKDYSKIINEIKDDSLRKKIKKHSNKIPAASKLEIEWYCKIHSHTWKTRVSRRILGNSGKKNGGHGCRYCGSVKTSNKSRKNLVGMRIGLLKIISFNKASTDRTRPFWNVLCDGCNKIKIMQIKNFEIQSCGCLKEKGLTLKSFLFLKKYNLKKVNYGSKLWLKWSNDFKKNERTMSAVR